MERFFKEEALESSMFCRFLEPIFVGKIIWMRDNLSVEQINERIIRTFMVWVMGLGILAIMMVLSASLIVKFFVVLPLILLGFAVGVLLLIAQVSALPRK